MTTRETDRRGRKVARCQKADYGRHVAHQCDCTRTDRRAYYGAYTTRETRA